MGKQAVSEKHRRRWDRFPDVGCIACGLRGIWNPQTQTHHLVSGGRRIGHHATVPLCPWHHQGIAGDSSYDALRTKLGPSMAKEPNEFRAEFGMDETLLASTNARLRRYGV